MLLPKASSPFQPYFDLKWAVDLLRVKGGILPVVGHYCYPQEVVKEILSINY
jgi:hypothetical protein